MKITFILGNGFDVQLGLKTRYSDFLTEYIQPKVSDDENIEAFKTYLREHINRELWSDAEKAMGEYLGCFSSSDIDKYTTRIYDFETELIKYLETQQSKCTYENAAKIKAVFTDFLFNSFDDVLNRRKGDLSVKSVKGTNTYRFITFNYTDLLEKILSCCYTGNKVIQTRQVQGYNHQDTVGAIHHVHGTLDSQIIMGVNDESQLNLSNGVALTNMLRWLLIKPQINRDSQNEWDRPALQVLSDSDIIAIYGVSYGETDRLWWSKICEWLKASSAHKLVAFTRNKDKKYNFKLPVQELLYEDSKRREILSKMGFSKDDASFEKCLSQVYIVSDTKRLEIAEVLLKDSQDKICAAV